MCDVVLLLLLLLAAAMTAELSVVFGSIRYGCSSILLIYYGWVYYHNSIIIGYGIIIQLHKYTRSALFCGINTYLLLGLTKTIIVGGFFFGTRILLLKI